MSTEKHMANNDPKETDPLWFWDILGDDESNLNENTTKENENFNGKSDSSVILSENIQTPDSVQFIKEEPNSVENESINGKGVQDKIIEDEISLKSELERSLFDLAKESIKKGKDPEFRITISSNDEANSEDNMNNDDFERILFNTGDQSRQNSQISNTIESYEKTIDIGNSDNENPTENSYNNINPKIYVVVKSNPSSNSKVNIAQDNTELNKIDEVYTNIGSNVINLNDFISNQFKRITGNDVSTSVNFLGDDDDKRKVELVITIKDERSKPSEEPATHNTYKNEINTDFPNLDSILNDEFLDSQIKRLSERTQKLANRANVLLSTDNSQTSKVSGDRYTQNSWSDCKETYVRASDGARCCRTVKNTPWGRRVQTHCYKEDHPGSRRRNYGLTSGVGSFLRDLDNDFDQMFNRINRLMFF